LLDFFIGKSINTTDLLNKLLWIKNLVLYKNTDKTLMINKPFESEKVTIFQVNNTIDLLHFIGSELTIFQR
jgi:hypothetical protein